MSVVSPLVLGQARVPFETLLVPLGMGIRGDSFLEFAQPVGFFPVDHNGSCLAGRGNVER